MSRGFFPGFAVALLAAATPAFAAPQQPASGRACRPRRRSAPPRVVAGQDGFAIESGNGDFRLQIGVLAHADGRFALDDENEQVIDAFVGRRLRPYLRGRLGAAIRVLPEP